MTEKDKIKQYLDFKGISKNSFYKKTGLSVGFLDSGKSLGVDKLKIIINIYPDINIEWIVLDKGDMIKQQESQQNETKETIIYKSDPRDIELIELQREHIKILKEQLTLGPARLDLNAPSTDPTPTPISAFAPPKRAKNHEKPQ